MSNDPITREEVLLNAVATGETAILEPITREEIFLAKLGGADVNTPTPITRKEQFLQKALESSGSGGGGADYGIIYDEVTSAGEPTKVTVKGKLVIGYALYRYDMMTTVNLTEGIKMIGNQSFYSCQNLTNIDFCDSLTQIHNKAFQSCTALTTVTLPKSISYIASDAFQSCTKLVTINVPWAEGAVSGAPWGATNATINYDYTGE